MERAIRAYLAGVLDSVGTIGIKKSTYSMRVIQDSTQPTYSERIHIRQVRREALDLFSETFGGNVTVEAAHVKRGKPLFCWGQTDKKATATLQALMPFLRIKAAQARNCLVLRAVKETSKKARVAKSPGHAGSAHRSQKHSQTMEALYQKAKSLNKVGV